MIPFERHLQQGLEQAGNLPIPAALGVAQANALQFKQEEHPTYQPEVVALPPPVIVEPQNKRLTLRDKNAPKRNLGPYLIYQNAMRDHFKALNPHLQFGDLCKYTAQQWEKLGPAEKQQWIVRAEEDKKRYVRELAAYVPAPGYDRRGDLILLPEKTTRVKRERDKNAPKRNLTAYLLYQNAMRDQIRQKHPAATFGELSKITSAMYKELTPEELALWKQRERESKEQYDLEMEKYTPPPGFDEKGLRMQDEDIVLGLKRRKKMSQRKRQLKPPGAPTRPRGSYVFFTFDARPRLLAEQPNVGFREMGCILGEQWRNLSSEEKQKYVDMAAEDKRRFEAETAEFNEKTQGLVVDDVLTVEAVEADVVVGEIKQDALDHIRTESV
mmetsp:Transcript_2821/g.4422  ORF Transcript_2821/g.4422 Transcript_2821/m.4422 type:complete len:384 (-) Transcript_2821:202-1353(-)|eukprot:CAMPEP_0196804974 /NCGR_PEP_ID=MMETSP1362-20130617/4680_1 /TAXON_ID=163516 /ORGANISM="Leptocylindrus danicus, Strain CCMP1856" /LENGTH=383 /DNA_ID=CAMNT_0042177585 /DNA_START=600 /DNA_END=1751 /DNA_ORIENTATION=+